jgi:dihydrofolate synthase/folylpolyglutamate synthase
MVSNQSLKGKAADASSIRSYDSALKYLYSQTDYEQMLRVRYNRDTFSLDRMRSLLKSMGNPHESLKAIHIAGTKGKGSTAMMLSSMLRGNGYRIGLYTSPHINDIRERISINGEMIPRKELMSRIAALAPVIEKMSPDKPTFFEIFTAISFAYFAENDIDIAIIETGLGGRLDSTNVITPILCGLTSISMDHMHQLGNTLGEIAAEKAGIIKPGVPAISAEQHPDVDAALQAAAKKNKSSLRVIGVDIPFSFRVESQRGRRGCLTRLCFNTEQSRFEHLIVPHLGEHQAINCGLALAMMDELKTQGMEIDDAKALEGLFRLKLPGRMEFVSEAPRILLDGAHNGASLASLHRSIGQQIPYDSLILVFGCNADKDIHGMMKQIATGADKVIFTRASTSKRATDPKELAELYTELSDGRIAQVTDSLEEAIAIAKGASHGEDLIVVTGSFYLVGEAKALITGKRAPAMAW